MNKYWTIKYESTGVFKDRKSKFIALAKNVKNENDIKNTLNSIKNEYADACHHCYAYRYVNQMHQVNEFWSDDGEPANSAGIQILYAIKKYDLLNVLVVVVRYFGGVKLSVPGLINAYKTATLEALDNALREERIISKPFFIEFKYDQLSKVMTCLKKNHVIVQKQILELTCTIEAEVHLLHYESLKQELQAFKIEMNEPA